MTTTNSNNASVLSQEQRTAKMIQSRDSFISSLVKKDKGRTLNLSNPLSSASINVPVLKRLEVQWNFLGDVMKGMSKCCRYGIPQFQHKDGSISGDGYVRVNYHESGKVSLQGVRNCKGLECSNCGGMKRRELAEHLEQALQWNAYNNGSNVFGTLTQKASSSTQCIIACSKAMGQVLRKMGQWNRKNGCKIALFSTQETLFSPTKGTTDREGYYDHSHYYHSHLHFVAMFPYEDLKRKERVIELLKEWWIIAIEKHGGIVLGTDGEIINESVAFRVDYEVNAPMATARYIAKHLRSMELVYAGTKTGKNLSLEQLKACLYLQPDYKPFIVLLRDYYKVMKNRTRFKSAKTLISEMVDSWQRRMDFLRTKEAYRLIAAERYDALLRLGQLKENIIVAQIKCGDEEGIQNSLEEEGYEFHTIKVKRNFTMWGDRSKKILRFFRSTHSFGSVTTLIEQVMVREKSMREAGMWAYLQKEPEREEDQIIMTIKIPIKLYDYLSNQGKVIQMIYRLRNFVKDGYDDKFYNLFMAIMKRVEFFGKIDEVCKKGLDRLMRITTNEKQLLVWDGEVF